MAAARAVLSGANDFLNDHPTNMEIFGRHLRSRKQAAESRAVLSVPLLDETVAALFIDKRDPQTRMQKLAQNLNNRKLKKGIDHDVKQSRSDPAWYNHRAAVEVIRQLPRAAARTNNQVLLVALVRFLESRQGQILNDAVENLPDFQALLDEYKKLEREREEIALAKIAEVHRRARERSLLREGPVVDLVQPQELIIPNEPEPIREKLIVVTRSATNEWPEDEWTIPGTQRIAIREPLEPTRRFRRREAAQIDVERDRDEFTNTRESHSNWAVARDEARMEREEAARPTRRPAGPPRRTPSRQTDRTNERGLGRELE